MDIMEKIRIAGKGGVAGASAGIVLIAAATLFFTPSSAFVEIVALVGAAAGVVAALTIN